MSRFNTLGLAILATAAVMAAGLAIRDSGQLLPVEPAVSQSRKWQGHRFEGRFLFGPPRRASFPRPIG